MKLKFIIDKPISCFEDKKGRYVKDNKKRKSK